MEVPNCCGQEMKHNIETSRFVEVQCQKCGDIVYLRKQKVSKPQLIDD